MPGPQQIVIPVQQYIQSLWPENLVHLPEIEAFEHVWMEPPNIQTEPFANVQTALVFETSLEVGIPGLDAVGIVIAPDGNATEFMLDFTANPTPTLSLVDMPIALRFHNELLKPVRRVAAHDGTPESWEVDPTVDHVDITLAKVTLSGDFDGNISLRTDLTIDMPPAMIGDSGVVIEAQNVGVYLDANSPPPGKPAGWRGVHIGHAALHLPGGLSGTIGTLAMTDCYIGNGGFSGTVSDTWAPALSATIGGMQCSLQSVAVTFVQNALTAASIEGTLTLPFFDEPLDVDIGLSLNGNFHVTLRDASGVLTLTKPGILSVAVNGLGFDVTNGVFTVHVSGAVTPMFGGLDWPTFQINDLAIDSNGNVHLDGGWIDLPSQYSLDFHGFSITITKLGFGKTDDGGKWIGFSGGLKLVDGLSAGASVDGLKVTWYDDGRDTKISLDGVGVEFEIPDVLRFRGSVSYKEPSPGVHRFDGSIRLELIALDLEIDGSLVIGSAPGYTFFAIYLDCELPAGIPLWATGLGLYGVAGLFALNMAPSRRSDQPWYEINSTTDYFHNPDVGVTNLATKWTNQAGAFALGGGITLGTEADNGFTFSGKMLLVISFPGPIIMIQGAANILKERSSLDDDPIFRALVVLDFNAGSFLIGLDLEYKYGSGGELIDIHGGCEAFFSTSDPSAWHLYLGIKDPREKRIRAEIFKLFEADTYFMLDAHQLAMGTWVGYDKHWSFGPLSLTIEAWIDGNAVVSWKPVHLHGDLWLHGKAELKVFGFGLGLGVDAKFAADVFDPFDVKAEFSVSIDLPWPLPDFSADVTLEFGPAPTPPPLPMPLKEIAIEHFKVTTSWPLPRTSAPALLVPNYQTGGDGFFDTYPPDGTQAATALAQPPPNGAPVVPLDARPHITFGRAVHDLAPVGVNPQPVVPGYERIGDPSKNQGPTNVRYSLVEVALHSYDGASWHAVARTGTTANPPGVPKLYGSWAPMPSMPDGSGSNAGQVKLWLWSKTPFDYTSHSGSSWDEWFTGKYPGYPCADAPPTREYCCDFDAVAAGTKLSSPFVCGRSGVRIEWYEKLLETVTALQSPVDGHTHELCTSAAAGFPSRGDFASSTPGAAAGGGVMQIVPPEPAREVRITLAPPEGASRRTCVDLSDQKQGTANSPYQNQGVVFTAHTAAGALAQVHFANFAAGAGILLNGRLEVVLPQAAGFVSVRLLLSDVFPTVTAFNEDGTTAGTATPTGPHAPTMTLTFTGHAIKRLTLDEKNGRALLAEICYASTGQGAVDTQAIGYDAQGGHFGPFSAHANVIDVVGTDMVRVVVAGRSAFCLVKVCCIVGETNAEKNAREAMMQHLRDELVRWSQTGEVLEPNTRYRLTVVTNVETADDNIGPDSRVTEMAYFQTQGPPGLATLSTPLNAKAPDSFTSGLDDLQAYVRQTVPATVPPPGQKLALPKPVYRGYDVGVAFNEDYVDLMYRIDGRDLGLYLYDRNNRPVRDARGAIVVMENRWGHADDVTLSGSDTMWINVVNTSRCANLDTTTIPHDVTLGLAGEVLDADTVYEARLVPLLLHETFASLAIPATAIGPAGTLGRWRIVDEGGIGAPSSWTVQQTGVPAVTSVVQTSAIAGGTADADDPVKPGTMLLYGDDPALGGADPAQPGNWTDYRISATVRSDGENAIGIVFRYLGAGTYYRFSMDRRRGYRRLVSVMFGMTTVLAEDDYVYQQGSDYQIVVEAVGSAIGIYQDGEPVFQIANAAIDRGRFGLYAWADAGARFADMRVDDFRTSAPVVYKFQFTTSKYVDVFHHLHGYQDETWGTALAGAVDISAQVAQAVAPPAPAGLPADSETRAYDALADALLGAQAHAAPPELQISRVEQNGTPLALLVRSPEPIDWARATLAFSHADRTEGPRVPPHEAKLTGVTFGSSQPNQESVAVLLRDAADLSRYRIEQRVLPDPLQLPAGNPTLFYDDFRDKPAGRLFTERFGPNALDHYTIVDDGTFLAPSHWFVSGGAIAQNSWILGGSFADDANKPGSMAVTGSPAWDNVRIRATLESSTAYGLGLIFRYQDRQNYYRLAMDNLNGRRRLSKTVAGVTTVLWQDAFTYQLNQPYHVEVLATADRLIGYTGGTLIFDVAERDVPTGRVGFYVWANAGAHFRALTVDSLETQPVLWRPPFADAGEVTVVDDAGAVNGPSQWSVASGVLRQTSIVAVPDTTPFRPGTYAIGGNSAWRDVTVSARLKTTSGGAMGVMFRYADDGNYYRLAWDSAFNVIWLIKRVAGTATLLWAAPFTVVLGTEYEMTVRAYGGTVTGSVNGAQLFSVPERDLTAGRIAFFARDNPGATFSDVLVVDPAPHAGAWTIHDEAFASAPSLWRRAGGAFAQRSPVGDLPLPEAAGTIATAGSSAWTDYRLIVKLRSDSDQAVGVVFRYTGENDYYRFSMDSSRSYRRLVKMSAGTATVLWQDGVPYAVGQDTTITIDAVGSRLVGYVGSARLFDVTDAGNAAGIVGLYAWNNQAVRFENVAVTLPPLDAYAVFADAFPAGDMTAWSVVDDGTLFGPSDWSAAAGTLQQHSEIFEPPVDLATLAKRGTHAVAGDPAWTDTILDAVLQSADGSTIGVMIRYRDASNYYRFSMDAVRGYRRLVKNVAGTFTLLWQDHIPYPAATPVRITLSAIGSELRGYVDGVPAFVVEDTAIPAGRIGLYTWHEPTASFSHVRVYPASQAYARWLFDAGFRTSAVGGWTFVDEGAHAGPSDWKVDVNAGLRQLAAIDGTVALANAGTFDDSRTTVRLRSDQKTTIGVLVRYADEQNFYRFSMDRATPFRKLEKNAGGSMTTLWHDAVRYQLHREYVVTIDCVGDRITGYVDGARIFSVTDAALAAGGIGLYCSNDPAATFREVRVAALQWNAYYAFGEEVVRSAGTRVQVFSGNASTAPAPADNVSYRFAALLDDPGSVRFGADAADLRLVDPNERVVHARRFFAPAVYGAVNARVIRRADGTGFVVVVPAGNAAGTELAPGQYRVALSYLRDNRAAIPTSQVFSENGSTQPESAALDAPWIVTS
jgi:hypothetical protein